MTWSLQRIKSAWAMPHYHRRCFVSLLSLGDEEPKQRFAVRGGDKSVRNRFEQRKLARMVDDTAWMREGEMLQG